MNFTSILLGLLVRVLTRSFPSPNVRGELSLTAEPGASLTQPWLRPCLIRTASPGDRSLRSTHRGEDMSGSGCLYSNRLPSSWCGQCVTAQPSGEGCAGPVQGAFLGIHTLISYHHIHSECPWLFSSLKDQFINLDLYKVQFYILSLHQLEVDPIHPFLHLF